MNKGKEKTNAQNKDQNQLTKKGATAADRVLKGWELANKSVDTGLRFYSTLGESEDKKDAQFIASHKTELTGKRIALVTDAVRRNEIKRMDGYAKLAEIQKDDEAETIRLMDARSRMKKATGDKWLKIGLGTGGGLTGLGVLIWGIAKAVVKHAA